MFGEWGCSREELKHRSAKRETAASQTGARAQIVPNSATQQTTRHLCPFLSLLPYSLCPAPSKQTSPPLWLLTLIPPSVPEHRATSSSSKAFQRESIHGIPQSLVRVVIARWVYRPAGLRVMRGRRVPWAPKLWCIDRLMGNNQTGDEKSVFVVLCQVSLKAFQQICAAQAAKYLNPLVNIFFRLFKRA